MPSQRRWGVTVDALVEAAIRILLRDGYETLTTILIAECAGPGQLECEFRNQAAASLDAPG